MFPCTKAKDLDRAILVSGQEQVIPFAIDGKDIEFAFDLG